MLATATRNIHWLKTTVKLFVFSIAVSSCTPACNPFAAETLGPEEIVERYLDIAFNMEDVGSKRYLLALTTGSLKAALNSASDEVIKKAYIDRSYDLKSYSVIQRRDRTPRETEITFLLTYRDLGDSNDPDNYVANPEEAALVTTENTVAVIKEKGNWLIREVLGNKTTIDFPVSEAAKIRARAGEVSPDPDADGDGISDDNQ